MYLSCHATDESSGDTLFETLSRMKTLKPSVLLIPRTERADTAKIHFDSYNPKQQSFLNFVLDQYVKSGVDELDESKLPDLLELKYHAIADAKNELGSIQSIRNTFIGFQEYLYESKAI